MTDLAEGAIRSVGQTGRAHFEKCAQRQPQPTHCPTEPGVSLADLGLPGLRGVIRLRPIRAAFNVSRDRFRGKDAKTMTSLVTVLAAVLFGEMAPSSAAEPKSPAILNPAGATPLETFAAREVRRYVYLRTGRLLPITQADRLPKDSDVIVVGRKDRPLVRKLAADAPSGAEQYLLRTLAQPGRRVLVIAGGDGVGTLYGAYRFAEKLGVRFYLHGDVVPDARMELRLPNLNETGKPLFDTRGIQPFHDFPEGPDWWNRDDYLAYVSQLAKMRMNFLGLHCYPEKHPDAEPLVWIGRPSDLDAKGRVKFSYPARWADTRRVNTWGYAPMRTPDFAAGADRLFAYDPYGPDVHGGEFPWDTATQENCNVIFNRVGDQMAAVMAHARALGVKTCIGTETPLTIPKLVQERLAQQSKNPKDPAVVRELYEGMFRRIAKVYPVDYYWLWTPEGWTWGGNKPEQFEATTRDMHAALDALKKLGDPFTLATSGWVLGPQHDRAALDKFLPKNVPMSCINRQVGHAPVEPSFANITGRPKWAIPWMENDPNLVAPQPWVGRMRHDAVDAKRYGCTGLLGIHWRTKQLAANVAALADAAWDQSWARDTAEGSKSAKGRDRTMPVEDFYTDFARINFGGSAAGPVGKLLAKIDGTNLPEPSTWIHGPGGIRIEKKPWSEIKAGYAFVDELAALRPQVKGAGNLERFDYWLNTYRFMAVMAELGCARGELDGIVAQLKKDKSLAKQAVALRVRMSRLWEKMLTHQLAATDTPGELGTIANLEQHNRVHQKFLTAHDPVLTEAIGAVLPSEIELTAAYTGPTRLIVPTVRTQVARGETLTLKVIVLSAAPPRQATLRWRPMGQGEFASVPLQHVKNGVHLVTFPVKARDKDFEYYVEVAPATGAPLRFPATAPAINQTLVMCPTVK